MAVETCVQPGGTEGLIEGFESLGQQIGASSAGRVSRVPRTLILVPDARRFGEVDRITQPSSGGMSSTFSPPVAALRRVAHNLEISDQTIYGPKHPNDWNSATGMAASAKVIITKIAKNATSQPSHA